MSTFAIILSLVLLIFFAYRGISVLILAPLMAALAVFLSGDIGFMLPIYTDTFMERSAGTSSTSFRCFCWAPCSAS